MLRKYKHVALHVVLQLQSFSCYVKNKEPVTGNLEFEPKQSDPGA